MNGSLMYAWATFDWKINVYVLNIMYEEIENKTRRSPSFTIVTQIEQLRLKYH